MISIWKAEHQSSFWNRGPRNLQMAYFDTTLYENMDLHKFALCKYVANM